MANAQHAVRIAQGEIKSILDKLDKMGNDVTNRVADEIEVTALEIETDAKKRCPVDTGRLRSSITTYFNRDRLAAVVGTNVEYAIQVEYGQDRRTPKPYLFPAYFKGIQGLVKRLKKITEE